MARPKITYAINWNTSRMLFTGPTCPFLAGRPTRLLTGLSPSLRRHQSLMKRRAPFQHTKPVSVQSKLSLGPLLYATRSSYVHLCNENLKWKALVSDRSHKRPWLLLGIPNWTIPLLLSSLKRPLSLIHINRHLNETAHCANDLKSLAVSIFL